MKHLLKRLCFINIGGRPRSAPGLLDYIPSYNSFQKGPTIKNLRQTEVTVSQLGKDQEDIIQTIPLTSKSKIQIPHLVTPLTDPNFIPSIQPSEVGLPVIRFPSLFDPTPQSNEDMPVQKRSINLGSMLEALVPLPSETSPPPPPLGFS